METMSEPTSMEAARKELVDAIIEIEWEMFTSVNNVGGPAACQSQDQTFNVMRRAQFSTWSLDTLDSYLHDLDGARAQGRNLMTEKYARMMSVTHPDEYAEIAPMLPPVTQEAMDLIDKIAAQHDMWDQAVTEEFPKLRARGRTQDEAGQEGHGPTANTYLIGELLTYSLPTLRGVMHDVEEALTHGHNIVRDQLESTVKQYGWPSIEEAEKHQ